jgi:hypothetical protein
MVLGTSRAYTETLGEMGLWSISKTIAGWPGSLSIESYVGRRVSIPSRTNSQGLKITRRTEVLPLL